MLAFSLVLSHTEELRPLATQQLMKQEMENKQIVIEIQRQERTQSSIISTSTQMVEEIKERRCMASSESTGQRKLGAGKAINRTVYHESWKELCQWQLSTVC